MSLLAVPIISVLALILLLIFGIVFKLLLSSLKTKVAILSSQQQVTELLVDELKFTIVYQQEKEVSSSTKYHDQNTATEQVIKQLEYRIKSLQSDFVTLEGQLQQYLNQQPEDKLYSRAFKLAAKGADLEEIIQECELPRAEAEMLLSVYHAKNN